MKIRVPVKVSIPRAGEFIVTVSIAGPREGEDAACMARDAEHTALVRAKAHVTPEGKRTIARALKRASK